MFTGIVASQGRCFDLVQSEAGLDFWIELGESAAGAQIGDSIAVCGCCLTIEKLSGNAARFHAGRETLELTHLSGLSAEDVVNLEPALKMGDPLGGHLVSGHVDGVGQIVDIQVEPSQTTMTFRLPPEGRRRVIKKGSIAIDGVSLTISDLQEDRLSVALIPHTLSVTGFGKASVGQEVNIEFDQLGLWIGGWVEAALEGDFAKDAIRDQLESVLNQRVEDLVLKTLRERGIT